MIETLVNLTLQLRHDESQEPSQLHRRDRVIGQSLSSLARRPDRQLAAWLNRISSGETRSTAERAAHALRAAALLVVALGIVSGFGASAAVFFYDGSRPVNVLTALAVFVGLPLLLLLPFAIAALPRGLLAWLPGMRTLQETLSVLVAGLIAGATRVLPQRHREGLQQALGRGAAHRRVYGRAHKWLLISWSQRFTVAFMTGALAAFAALVLSTDLAFSWSTTLDLPPETFREVVQAVSRPWAEFVPAAVPSQELIESTRYFRLESGPGNRALQPEKLGGWWPFVMACIVLYGLLPRVVTTVFSSWRYRAAVRWSLCNTPGAADVLDRLNSSWIETRAPIPEPVPDELTMPRSAESREVSIASRAGSGVLINWSAVPFGDSALRQAVGDQLGYSVGASLAAGAVQSLEADSAVLRTINRYVQDEDATNSVVVVVVKAWEPPILEFVDFIRELREALGEGMRIIVTPVLTGEDGVAQSPALQQQWHAKMATIGDPWLTVRPVDCSAIESTFRDSPVQSPGDTGTAPTDDAGEAQP